MYQNGKNITIIDHNVNCVEAIEAELRKRKPLTEEQEHELCRRMQEGDKRACDRLVEGNMRYAMRVAKQYLPSGAALEDLFQAGCEGLVKAAHKFDATLGYHFISFATWFVENEVRLAANDYIRHDLDSLDESVDKDDAEGPTLVSFISGPITETADWNLRYRDALNSLKMRLDDRMHGLGRLAVELHQMLLDGYSTSDFARRHRLSPKQMDRLFTMIREEAAPSIPQAA